MHWLRHRRWLALAAGLDALGVCLLAAWIVRERDGVLENQLGLLAMLVAAYLSLGWLFGSFTLVKTRRLRWSQLVVRLVITSAATTATGAVVGWLLRAAPEVTLLHRGSLMPLFTLAALWSAGVRLMLRQLAHSTQQDQWAIVTLPGEQEAIRAEWERIGATRAPSIHVLGDCFSQLESGPDGNQSSGLALSQGVLKQPDGLDSCARALAEGRPVTSLALAAEQELQRIPPHWVEDQWLLFSDRSEQRSGGFERQLKRYADVMVSLLLLLICTPVLAIAAALIRITDGGPVLYRQKRTGLQGKRFEVIKLRTMVPDAEEEGEAIWSDPNDGRITPVGHWLRRTRLDELPQLINVLRGEMSLIGPRPERPELETDLERRIPNYRLRHWIRPGLSGWAQVNMPYTSTVEDAELKLSYDLFYLRNSSVWLDLLILFKTIKIVLKAAGR
ncbi:exopolysaccharide biosynthesis polyprenyl glycosylphosphotransferase [Synechococcus sp. RedBA-s]|uniref:exopolysaccharide biosynthesis polyprenyl glycosylphosphotransferase n=1 Tax=Synechococcus sp. RedBA-s TaxID=2823741 RepID=UPI0020CFBB34|nr:exopolysaccharide biosynthesis polyprenyl glycosylphosphotransferase [Synechococcus sp. RedBA-s]MCP9799207.1 exopolysaccharide biosynthesis polyprenyl glycosylphosphotransferase [Synechococcus sp. RedBA-s]